MPEFIRILLFFVDLAAINLCIYLSVRWTPNASGLLDVDGIYLIAFSNITWLFLVMISTPYNITKGWSATKILKSQSSFIFIHLLVVIALVIFFNKQYPVLQIVLIYVIFFPLFFISRLVTFYFRRLLAKEIQTTNFIIIGQNELGNSVRKYFLMNPAEGRKFQGYFDATDTIAVDELEKVCVRLDVHEIYCCVEDVEKSDMKNLVEFGLDSLIKVRIVANDHLPDSKLLYLDASDNKPRMDVAAVALDDPRNQLVKRIADIIVSSFVTLFVLSWLIPLIGLLIKLESRGPVFFLQPRDGKDNKPFQCLKFRSMVVNKESDTLQATKNDMRITKFGKFLRKSSIDELPQFLNVLSGDMSLVGPRPHPVKLNEKFSAEIRNLMSRHYVKPGITGLAQCMGYRGETAEFADMENRFRLDRYYIENWSFWLDIKIIFLTVVSLIRGSEKAY